MSKISHIRSAPKFKQTVLLIDDQPTVLNIHMAIIKSLDMDLNIVSMTDPVAALNWLQNKQVDLIITDYQMHKMNGMQFVQTLKNDHKVPTQNILVVTVLKDQATHQELIAAGAAGCLTKPVNSGELANFAKKLLVQSNAYYGQGHLN